MLVPETVAIWRAALNKAAASFDFRDSEDRAAFRSNVANRTKGIKVTFIRQLAQAFGCPAPRRTRVEAAKDLANCWIEPRHRGVYARSPVKQNPRKKGVAAALAAVPEPVRRAAVAVHEKLSRAGIPHMLVGGLAVGAHGYPRATQDADFMVSDDAFILTRTGLVLGMQHGLPHEVNRVAVDYLSPKSPGEARALAKAGKTSRLQAAPVEVLVRMKLTAGRARDEGDVVEVLKAGTNRKKIRAFLVKDAPSLLSKFDALCARADEEAP